MTERTEKGAGLLVGRHVMMDALKKAIDETPHSDRVELLSWTAERVLLGLAKLGGTEFAAEFAYRLGDLLVAVSNA